MNSKVAPVGTQTALADRGARQSSAMPAIKASMALRSAETEISSVRFGNLGSAGTSPFSHIAPDFTALAVQKWMIML